MGFPSPAQDYVQRPLCLNQLFNVNGNTLLIETSSGWAVIDKSRRPDPGIVLLVNVDGYNQFARWMGDALITEEGEAIEGEALDGVTVIGPVIALINAVGRDDDCPVM
jgi:DNA polymerase V